jgi:RHS repeat-associated protein
VNTSDYKYTDQELDNESGLYNYDARMYDPVIGRFISTDPLIPNYNDFKEADILNPQILGRYTYCLNNPLTYIDPSGLLTVYYWNHTNSHWGHVAMRLEDGTDISWWPSGEDRHGILLEKDIYSAPAVVDQTIEEASGPGFEDKKADLEISINGLDEKAIKAWWNEFKGNHLWKSLSQNCSTTVSDGLKAGGAKVKLSDIFKQWNLIWTPNDIKKYAQAIKEYEEQRREELKKEKEDIKEKLEKGPSQAGAPFILPGGQIVPPMP